MPRLEDLPTGAGATRETEMLRTSTLDGATAPPEPNVMCATPGEFAAMWNGLTEDARQEVLNALRVADDMATRCRVMHRPPPPIGRHREGMVTLDLGRC